MKLRMLMPRLLAALCFSTAAMAAEPAIDTTLTAAQIVEKNVAARGGLDAWRKIRTMGWVGHVETASAPGGELPFVLQFERPNKTRFAVDPQGQSSVRIFDGNEGWKLRRTNGGPPEALPYTAEEVKFAQDGQGIDGLLIDHDAKGISVVLDGADVVEGRSAYRLNVRLPSGAIHHVWIDAQTFLDVKSDRQFRSPKGFAGTVSMVYRNYQSVEGVQIPLTIESGGATSKATDKMVIDKISINPLLDANTFARPSMPLQRKKVIVDTRVPPPAGAASPRPLAARTANGDGH